MGIVVRQSLKASIVYYIGTIIGTINVIFLYNIFLNQDELGLVAGSLISIPIIIAAFAQLGIPHIIVRFFPHFEDISNGHNGFFNFVILSPIFGILLFAIGFFSLQGEIIGIYKTHSPLLPLYFWLIFPITLAFIYISVLEAYIRVHYRIVYPGIIKEIFQRLSNSVLIILYGLKFIDFQWLLVLIMVSYWVNVIFLVVYIKKLKVLFLNWSLNVFRSPVFKEMCIYGCWVILAGGSFAMIQHLEKVMLPAYAGGLTSTAIFDVNSRIALMIAVPKNMVGSISAPLLASAYKTGDFEQQQTLYQKSTINLFIVGTLIFLLIWLNINDIYNLIPNGDLYKVGIWVILFVGLSKIIDMLTGLNSELLINSKFYKWDLIFYVVLSIIIVMANLILIPTYGYNGAALASLGSLLIYNIVKFLFIWKKMGFQPFNKTTVQALILFLILWICVAQWPETNNNSIVSSCLRILIKSSIVIMVYIICILRYNLSTELKLLIFQVGKLFGISKNN